MAERYVGWTCGKCGKPVAGRFSVCECGFAPETYLVQPPAPKPEPQPNWHFAPTGERDRDIVEEAAYFFGGAFTERVKARELLYRALAAARAEGRAEERQRRQEAIEECARLVDAHPDEHDDETIDLELFRGCCEILAARIRALAGGEGG